MLLSVFSKARCNLRWQVYFMAKISNRHCSNEVPRNFILEWGKVLTVCLEKVVAENTADKYY